MFFDIHKSLELENFQMEQNIVELDFSLCAGGSVWSPGGCGLTKSDSLRISFYFYHQNLGRGTRQVMYAFIPSPLETEAGGYLSLRMFWST